MNRILIFGHLGVGNIGDEAMLPGILQAISSVHPDTEFVIAAGSLRDANLSSLANVCFVPRTPNAIVRSMFRCHCLVIAGGTCLASFRGNRRHMFGILRHWVLYRLAKLLGLRVYLVGIGLGPFQTRMGNALACMALRATDYITVRDRDSHQFLRASGYPRHRFSLCGDPAIFLDIPPRSTSGPHLGISVMQYYRHHTNDPAGDARLQQQMAVVIRRWLDFHPSGKVSLVCFLSQRRDSDDLAMARRIKSQLADEPVDIVDPAGSLRSCLSGFRSFTHFVSMRYHSQVLAWLFGIPQVVVAYHKKNYSFADHVEMSPEFIVDIDDFVRGRGMESFDTMFGLQIPRSAAPESVVAKDSVTRVFPRHLEEIMR